MDLATGRSGLLERLLGLLGRRPAMPGASAESAPDAHPFIAVVVTMGPDHAAYGDRVAASLEGRPGLAVTRASAAGEEGAVGAATAIRIRHVLAEASAEVAVWVEAAGRTVRLRWIAPAHPDEDRPGSFGPEVRLDAPATLDEALVDLVLATTLAAMQPAGDERRRMHGRLLDAAAVAASAIGEAPPFFADPIQQATIRLCFGHVAAASANAGDSPAAWLERAVAAYRAALDGLRPDDLPPLEEATAHRRLAAALTALAEHKGDDVACLQEALAACRAAAEILPRGAMPGEWAAEQARLGMALYRLDLRTGDASLLRKAIGAFQGALQVFTRADAPLRWAEIMHNLAQALEIYGDQSRNLDILRKAAEACRAVLEVRTPENDRAGWAATLNTLGSALFLLDKHGDAGHLDEAAGTLRTAAAAFHALGAVKPAQVAERNLAHVERLSRQRRDRPTAAEPDWAAPATPPAEE